MQLSRFVLRSLFRDNRDDDDDDNLKILNDQQLDSFTFALLGLLEELSNVNNREPVNPPIHHLAKMLEREYILRLESVVSMT